MQGRAALLVMLAVGLAAAQPVAPQVAKKRLGVIIPAASTITTLSTGDLRRTYLGTITRWPDGQRIVLVVLRSESAEQRAFLKRVVQMTDIDYAQHWIGEVFRGRASAPPHVAASPADAVRFVASHPNAIAVIAPEAADASVRLLDIDGKSVLDEDYPLMW